MKFKALQFSNGCSDGTVKTVEEKKNPQAVNFAQTKRTAGAWILLSFSCFEGGVAKANRPHPHTPYIYIYTVYSVERMPRTPTGRLPMPCKIKKL